MWGGGGLWRLNRRLSRRARLFGGWVGGCIDGVWWGGGLWKGHLGVVQKLVEGDARRVKCSFGF